MKDEISDPSPVAPRPARPQPLAPTIPYIPGFARGSVFSPLGDPLKALGHGRALRPSGGGADLTTVEFPMPGVATGGGQLLPFPPGLVIVSGVTGAGKTTFIKALARHYEKRFPHRASLSLVSEPMNDPTEDALLPQFVEADAALEWALKLQSSSRDILPVLDSLRGPLFETNGAAGPKGIIMPFFIVITRLSMALAAQGRTVMATINPMDDDAAFVSLFNSKLSASVPSFIQVTGVAGGNVMGSYSRRPGRAPVSFTLALNPEPSRRSVSIDDYVVSIPSEEDVVPSLTTAASMNTLAKPI